MCDQIKIRGYELCQRCGEYVLSEDYDYSEYKCDVCVYEEEEEDVIYRELLHDLENKTLSGLEED